jgi:hypothetical protein
VDGQRYLPCERHESLLRGGLYCELFIESIDEWVPAVIISTKEVAIPHTTLTLKTFDVQYTTTSAAAGGDDTGNDAAAGDERIQARVEIENGVRSDRLRLLVDDDGNVLDAQGVVVIQAVEYDEGAAAEAAARAAPIVVESTGSFITLIPPSLSLYYHIS